MQADSKSACSSEEQGVGSIPTGGTNYYLMKTVLLKLFVESNRYKHFLYAIPIGAIFTILCVLGIASGMEFKDYQYGNKFDWIDWVATIIGGIVGQVIQLSIIMLFI